MLIQVFSKLMIVLDYQANKSYIAQVLCINREKPKMQCHGKCYLKKNLKKAEQTETPSSNKQTKQSSDLILFYQPFTRITHLYLKEQPFLISSLTAGIPAGVRYIIFHPPQKAA
ncbi:hypothetical protein EFB08_04215 [Rufibacter latericius]|uniref:Uncharacterized protein n=2 Tax=Rufibacter latericius TaxID=2487040 RepID=A0A3M9MY46_9BACT|nr:hypothetical protein EFB08_04215 [Rufibacter latericius]